MYKAYKFRMYPDKEQEWLINKTFGCNRFIYNYYLRKMKDNKYQNVYSNISDYVNKLKYEYLFLQEIDSVVIRKSIFNLDNAYKKMFKEKSGYPKYKSRFGKNSYNTTAIYSKYKNKINCNIEVDLTRRMIKLPKLKWIKIRGYRNISYLNGRIINATISREPNGKYYVSVLYEVKDYIKEVVPRSIVGIDLGIKKLITLSDGMVIDNNKYILKYEKRIKRKQREISRKEKRSKNYYKCKKELAILYSKLANARKYYLHIVTKKITDTYDIVVTEKLNTKSMILKGVKNKLSKRINDASFHEIIRQLEYKMKWKGKKLYQIDTYYPSSQICSCCNHQDKKYKELNERKYQCLECGMELDRDINASINIMYEGLKLHMKEIYNKN